jgi:hypothetical protein
LWICSWYKSIFCHPLLFVVKGCHMRLLWVGYLWAGRNIKDEKNSFYLCQISSLPIIPKVFCPLQSNIIMGKPLILPSTWMKSPCQVLTGAIHFHPAECQANRKPLEFN